jgi:hypothetical protein
MMTKTLPWSWAALPLLLVAACGDDTERLQGTNNNNNNSSGTPDAGLVADAGTPDAGNTPDAGTVTPVDDTVRTQDVGTFPTGPNGETAQITFDLPSDATSFMVLLEGPDTVTFIIKTLTGPNGEVLVTDDTTNVTQVESFLLGPFAAQFKSPNRVIQDVGLAAALFPNNPAVGVGPGTYTMVATGLTITGNQGAPFIGQVQVRLLYRTKEPTAGLVPVTLYFTGAGDITAATAPDDAFIQGALTRLGEIYAQANLQLGAVAYKDVDARFRTIDATGQDGLLEELFTQSAGSGPGLHYFFVDRFEGGFPGAMVAGISGGLPGPARAVGSVNAGVAVAVSVPAGDSGVLAHVMAHEGGHWLGLFHTSEVIGTEDQMPDTPAGQAGNTYLMYPAVGGGTTVTESQAAVMRRHMEVIGQ